MKGTLIILLIVFSVMEIMAWKVYTASKEKRETESVVREAAAPSQVDVAPVSQNLPSGVEGGEENTVYPRITVEEKSGVTERTIHMGVRQWAWDPSEIRVKQGELVRLVIHNADIRHAIVIPDLGVEADIPEEGAIVEFIASRRGTFDFLCATYCGTGHAMMQGRMIVE